LCSQHSHHALIADRALQMKKRMLRLNGWMGFSVPGQERLRFCHLGLELGNAAQFCSPRRNIRAKTQFYYRAAGAKIITKFSPGNSG